MKYCDVFVRQVQTCCAWTLSVRVYVWFYVALYTCKHVLCCTNSDSSFYVVLYELLFHAVQIIHGRMLYLYIMPRWLIKWQLRPYIERWATTTCMSNIDWTAI